MKGFGFGMQAYKPYLEGQGVLVSGLTMGINGATMWVIGLIDLLTESP